ncbi:cytochrome P450 [Armillaria mellea]|nr:cytochrome P450 [Armillaria mellea]
MVLGLLIASFITGATFFTCCFHRPIRGDTGVALEILVGIVALFYRRAVFLETYLNSFIASGVFLVFQVSFLILSAIAYRLSPFHPLSKYPGPLLAKSTSLYLTHTVWTGKRHLIFNELHRRLGPFAQILSRSTCTKLFYPSTVQHQPGTKPDAYHLGGLAGAGLFFIPDREEHNARKKYWAPAFTNEALASYESMIERRTNDFILALSTRRKERKGVVDVTSFLQYWAHDITGEFAFGDTWKWSFCRDGDHLGLVDCTGLETAAFEIFGQAPSLSHLLWYLPPTKIFRIMDAVSDKSLSIRRKEGSQQQDLMTHLLGECNEGMPKLKDEHLRQEGALALLAGTNGISSALTFSLFYIASNSTIYSKLKKELHEAFPDSDALTPLGMVALTELDYLNAVVNESLRLGAPLGNFPRVTPKGGAVIGGEYIAEGCIVSVPAWAQMISEDNFYPHPEQFIPERWLPGGLGPDSRTNRNAMMTFSHGPFGCMGKQFVYQQMRLLLSRMILTYDFKLPDGFDPSAFIEGIENRRTTSFTYPLELVII